MVKFRGWPVEPGAQSRRQFAFRSSTTRANAKLFINRELSWLEFNERVLEEARDPAVPLLERLKFLAIVASNLDEFFMVRVAGLKQQLYGNVAETPPDGLTAAEQLAAISQRAHAMVAEQYRIWRDEIAPGLARGGHPPAARRRPDARAEDAPVRLLPREVWPVLTPLAVDPGHPFPILRNRSLNLASSCTASTRSGAPRDDVAVVQVPSVLPRITCRAPGAAPGAALSFMLLEDLIALHAGDLFPGFRVSAAARSASPATAT